MTRYPLLYQVNTRAYLTELSQSLGRRATLDDVPDSALAHWASQGFHWIWWLSVWQTGPQARQVSRSHPGWLHEFRETLPDLQDDDIPGSGFAITAYEVHSDLGGTAALARLRQRMAAYGLKLMLDFVPNHMGLGHEWVETHPERFVAGSPDDLAREPQNYLRIQRTGGETILAHGRDPYFDGWPDTLQLDYANPQTQEAMIAELERIAGQCDGVRCDMAMLVLPEVYERTWGRRAPLFWPHAIERVRQCVPGFAFLAEVYWDMEWTLQQQGFDFTYDKRLYDRLRDRHARPVREHFWAGLDYQDRLARFLENHDEARAAQAFPPRVHEAAAVVTFLSPGLRFFHEGQFDGRTKRISPHLNRRPVETLNGHLAEFYGKLLTILRQPALHAGRWQLLACESAWSGNGTHEQFLAWMWTSSDHARWLIVVNYADHHGQCYVRLPSADLNGRAWRLSDQLSGDVYERTGHDLQSRGLYVDMQPWQACVFEMCAM